MWGIPNSSVDIITHNVTDVMLWWNIVVGNNSDSIANNSDSIANNTT